MKKIDVILVSYRTQAEADRIVADLETMTGCPYDLYLFDNIGNPKTLTIAWNDLAAQGTSEYIAFLNPDIIISPGWGANMVACLELHPEIGALLPTPFLSGQPLRDPSGALIEWTWENPPSPCDMEKIAERFSRFPGYGVHEGKAGFYAVLLRRKTWESLKGFDERFTFYGQDHEFQDRMLAENLVTASLLSQPFWSGDGLSTLRAIHHGEISIRTEYQRCSEVQTLLREGKIPRWHLLSDEERRAVRDDWRYNKIAQPVRRHIPDSLREAIAPFTMVEEPRLSNLYRLSQEIETKNIPGAFVECGTWKGGCAGIAASVIKGHGYRREVHLLDSFEGLPQPSEVDGMEALKLSDGKASGKLEGIGQFVALRTDVEDLLFTILGIAPDKVHIHAGWFQEVLPRIRQEIGPIALLHVDADWHDSTLFCLESLYEQVSPGGYVVIDDYGHWEGCKAAVSYWMRRYNLLHIPLVWVDYTAVYFQKA